MRKTLFFFLIPALLATPSPAAAGELRLFIQNGLVTLAADDVPLSMIMAEWARIGGTKIVNGERLMTRVTLSLVDVPERRALEVVLRSASGFMAAERQTAAGPSVFESIMILPTSTPPANSGPLSSPPPAFVGRPMVPAPPMPEPDEGEPEVPIGMQPQPGAQPQPPGAGQPGMPNAPLTAPRPGQLPPPQSPQQPVPFGTPPKPGGGGPGGRPSGGPGGAPDYEPDRSSTGAQAQ